MKALVSTMLVLFVSASTLTQAATFTFGANSGTNQNAGGDLSAIDDGDYFYFNNTGLDMADSGTTSVDFTVVDGLNTVDLRMTWAITGTLSHLGGGATNVGTGESITISFQDLSGTLDTLSLDQFVVRGFRSGTDGEAGNSFTLEDDGANGNTWYSVNASNANVGLIGTTVTTFTDSSTYTGGNPAPSVDPDAGLNVLTSANIDTWTWTYTVNTPSVEGGAQNGGNVSLNRMDLTVTAVPEPSSLALTLIAGVCGAIFMRRKR